MRTRVVRRGLEGAGGAAGSPVRGCPGAAGRTVLNSTPPGPFGFTRRRFLGLTLAGGSALLMGGGAGLWSLRGPAPTVPGLSMLSAHEHRTLTALARTHLPPGGAFPPGAEGADLAGAFDRFLEGESAVNVRDLKRALVLMEYGPILFDRHWTTFSNLSDEERLAHWRSWLVSGSLFRRQASVAFRKFLSLVFYDRPGVWEHIGYPGPSLMPEPSP